MTWAEVKKTLTTPPPPRPPEPKYPLFTKSWTSTKSFGPGHLVGAGILGLGIFGLVKYSRHAQTESARRLAQQQQPQQRQQPQPARRPEDEPKVAQAENQRGQYGQKP